MLFGLWYDGYNLWTINLNYVKFEHNRIRKGFRSSVIELSRKYFVGGEYRTPGNFARWALKLLNPALRAIAVSSMLNANAAFGSLAFELRESQFPFTFLLSSFPYDPHEFNGRRKLNRPVLNMKISACERMYKSRTCCEYILRKCPPFESPWLI